jgi:hypothetical protein
MGDVGQIVILTLVFALAGGLVTCFGLMARAADHNRIRERIEDKGGQVLEINWLPFGPGWFGSRERIYEVSYTTQSGHSLTAICKTSMFSGVYWTTPEDELDGRQSSDPFQLPAMAVTCPTCGDRFQSTRADCPGCGWKHKR